MHTFQVCLIKHAFYFNSDDQESPDADPGNMTLICLAVALVLLTKHVHCRSIWFKVLS